MPYLIPTNTCFGLAASIADPQGYQEIFLIKKRPHTKPLAIIVQDFERLAMHTELTNEQISFLKNYKSPFTILTKSELLDNFFAEQSRFDYQYYPEYAFRVAHTKEQVELIQQVGPLFLTSANLSGEKENYSWQSLEKIFAEELEAGKLEKIGPFVDLPQTPPSEIFRFDGDSLKQIFLRS